MNRLFSTMNAPGHHKDLLHSRKRYTGNLIPKYFRNIDQLEHTLDLFATYSIGFFENYVL